jgi:hypothetical protein
MINLETHINDLIDLGISITDISNILIIDLEQDDLYASNLINFTNYTLEERTNIRHLLLDIIFYINSDVSSFITTEEFLGLQYNTGNLIKVFNNNSTINLDTELTNSQNIYINLSDLSSSVVINKNSSSITIWKNLDNYYIDGESINQLVSNNQTIQIFNNSFIFGGVYIIESQDQILNNNNYSVVFRYNNTTNYTLGDIIYDTSSSIINLKFIVSINGILLTETNYPDYSYIIYRDGEGIDISGDSINIVKSPENSAVYIVKIFYNSTQVYYSYVQIVFPSTGELESAGTGLIPWIRSWFYTATELNILSETLDIYKYLDVYSLKEFKPRLQIDSNGTIFLAYMRSADYKKLLSLQRISSNNVLINRIEFQFDDNPNVITDDYTISLLLHNDKIYLGYNTLDITTKKYDYKINIYTYDLIFIQTQTLSTKIDNFPFNAQIKNTNIIKGNDNTIYFSFNHDISGYDESGNIINYDLSDGQVLSTSGIYKQTTRLFHFTESFNLISELDLLFSLKSNYYISINHLYYYNNNLYVSLLYKQLNDDWNMSLLKYNNNNLIIHQSLTSYNTEYDELNNYITIDNDTIYMVYTTFGEYNTGLLNNQFGEIIMTKMDLSLNIDLNFGVLGRKHIRGSKNADYPLGIHIWQNNIYMLALTNGIIEGLLNVSKGINNIAIYKIDLDGDVIWVRQYNDFNKTNIYASDIIYGYDSNGNLYVAFNFYNGSFRDDVCLFKMIHPEYLPSDNIDISGVFNVYETITANVNKITNNFDIYTPSKTYQWQYFTSNNINNINDITFWEDISGATTLSYTIPLTYYKKYLRLKYSFINIIEDNFTYYSNPTPQILIETTLIPELNYSGNLSYLTFNPEIQIPFPTTTEILNAQVYYVITDESGNNAIPTDVSAQIIDENLLLYFSNTGLYNLEYFSVSEFGVYSDSINIELDIHEDYFETINTMDISQISLSLSKLIDGSSVYFNMDTSSIFPPISEVSNMNFIVRCISNCSFKLQIYTKTGILSIEKETSLIASDNVQLLTFDFSLETFKLLTMKEYTIKITCLDSYIASLGWLGARRLSSSPIIGPILYDTSNTEQYVCIDFIAFCTFDIDIGHEPYFYYNSTRITTLPDITRYVKPHIKSAKITNYITVLPTKALDFSNNELEIITNLNTDVFYKQGTRSRYYITEDKYGRRSQLNVNINIFQDLDNNNQNDLSQNYLEIGDNLVSKNKGGNRIDMYIQPNKTRFYKNGKASMKPINNNNLLKVLELNKHTLKNQIIINLNNNKIIKF